MERSAEDLAGCGGNGKLRLVGRQLDNWWETFWAQGDDASLATIELNRAANKANLLKQVFALRFNWETGYSFDAGKRLGNFWKILIGEPSWTDTSEHYRYEEPLYFERYPLGDFYGGLFETIWQVDFYD